MPHGLSPRKGMAPEIDRELKNIAAVLTTPTTRMTFLKVVAVALLPLFPLPQCLELLEV